MRVYVKKKDKKSMIPGLIVTIIFTVFPICVLIGLINSKKELIDALIEYGSVIVFAIIFLGFGLFFVYSLIKSPKGYKATLVTKKSQTYNGKQITYMKFSTQKEKEQDDDFISTNYYCYTFGENDLIINKNYSLKIKEYNWEPKYVEELTEENNVLKSAAVNGSNIAFLIVGSIFAGLALLSILGLIIWPHYFIAYIICFTFFTFGVYYVIKMYKQHKLDNNFINDEKSLNLKLEKINPIYYSQENVEKIDEKLVKKYNINILENFDIINIKEFKIFRPTKNTIFPQYFIVDKNNNLLLRIKKSNLVEPKFDIIDHRNTKVGEIKLSVLSLTNEYIINIVNEKPFIVRSKIQLHSDYQIIGRNYIVKGDVDLIRNIILDNMNNPIAFMSSVSKNDNNWYELGNTVTVLNENVNNNINIMLIALCVTMGNLKKYDR